MNKIRLLVFSFLALSQLVLGQNNREELERNKVKHISITGWIKSPDGSIKRAGNNMRVEKDIDSKGNNIATVVFISYKNEKVDSINNKYDLNNRPVEKATYSFTGQKPYLKERQVQKYDDQDRIIYSLLEEGNRKSECEYSYVVDKNKRLTEKTSKCKDATGESLQSVNFSYDKFGNLILESSSTSTPVKYMIKYFKKGNQMEYRLNLSTLKQEFFNENGELIKISQPGSNLYYKYDQKRNVVELTEDWQSSITGAKVYKQDYDAAGHLIQKTETTGKSDAEQNEKWTYSDAGLLLEYAKGSELERYEYVVYK